VNIIQRLLLALDLTDRCEKLVKKFAQAEIGKERTLESGKHLCPQAIPGLDPINNGYQWVTCWEHSLARDACRNCIGPSQD